MTQQQVEVPGTVILPPQTALQLGGQSLTAVTAALSAQPLMLTVVLLNLVFAGVGGYFLLQLERYRAANLTALIELVRSCVLQTAPLATLQTSTEQYQSEVERLRSVIDDLRKEASKTTPQSGNTNP